MTPWYLFHWNLAFHSCLEKLFEFGNYQAKYYSVKTDCTADVSHQEQLLLVLRVVQSFLGPMKMLGMFPYAAVKYMTMDTYLIL